MFPTGAIFESGYAHIEYKEISMNRSLQYTSRVAEVTAPIYEKVKKVIPEIEWPVHAPYVAAINELKKKIEELKKKLKKI